MSANLISLITKKFAIVRWVSCAALVSIFLITPAIAQENSIYQNCTVCHGANVKGNEGILAPKLSNMEAWYIENQLKGFRSGFRGKHVSDPAGREMQAIARGMTDAQIADAVKYVSQLKSTKAPVTVEGDVKRGEALYIPCQACHGANGEGLEALNSPALAHQSDWYLIAELNDYRNGARGTASGDIPGAQMRAMAQVLTDEQAIRDVVAYIKTLAP